MNAATQSTSEIVRFEPFRRTEVAYQEVPRDPQHGFLASKRGFAAVGIPAVRVTGAVVLSLVFGFFGVIGNWW
jgi:hypothetical protein